MVDRNTVLPSEVQTRPSQSTRYSTGHFSLSLLRDTAYEQWWCLMASPVHPTADAYGTSPSPSGNLLLGQETSSDFLQDKHLLGESDVESLLEATNCSLMLLRKAGLF